MQKPNKGFIFPQFFFLYLIFLTRHGVNIKFQATTLILTLLLPAAHLKVTNSGAWEKRSLGTGIISSNLFSVVTYRKQKKKQDFDNF